MIKKTSGKGDENEKISNRVLAEKLHKTIIRIFKKWKVHSPFIGNIWGAHLTDMQLISKFNKIILFYYVLLIFTVNKHKLFL